MAAPFAYFYFFATVPDKSIGDANHHVTFWIGALLLSLRQPSPDIIKKNNMMRDHARLDFAVQSRLSFPMDL